MADEKNVVDEVVAALTVTDEERQAREARSKERAARGERIEKVGIDALERLERFAASWEEWSDLTAEKEDWVRGEVLRINVKLTELSGAQLASELLWDTTHPQKLARIRELVRECNIAHGLSSVGASTSTMLVDAQRMHW